MNLPTVSGKWNVRHGKDFFADLVRTRNLSFDKEGFIQLAKKPICLYTSGDDSNLNSIIAIVPDATNSIYYVITTGKCYSVTTAAVFTALTITGAPNVSGGSDALFFNGVLHVSGSTTVHSYAGSWTSRITGLSASYPIVMAVFEDRLELSVGNGNVVKNYNTSYVNNGSSTPFTLTLPAEYVVTSLRWRGGKMYIGTRHIYGGVGKLFVWDGGSTTCPPGYGVGTQAIYSLVEYDGTICAVTSRGQILRFNGAGFDELAHFPIYDTTYLWGLNASIAAASYDVCPNRATAVIGNRLYLNVKGDRNANFPPGAYLHEQPSGLWVYDPLVGLHHRAGHAHTDFLTLTVTALNSSILRTATHGLATGDPVYAASVANITGLTSTQIYYAIVINTTDIQLALTQQDAVNGNYLVLSGTPSGDTVSVDDKTGYGAVIDVVPGAISPFSSSALDVFHGSSLLFGSAVNNNTGTSIRSVCSLGLQANRGHFTTSPIPATGIQDLFHKLYLIIQDLTYAADSVIVKYRLIPRAGLPTMGRLSVSGLATWASTTTFTIDSRYKFVGSAQIGDEVEVISGSASGWLTKITNITQSGTTYTFTVSDTMPVSVSDKSEVTIDNWTLATPAFTSTSGTASQNFLEIPLAKKGTMIQFKVELRGWPKVREATVVQTSDKPRV